MLLSLLASTAILSVSAMEMTPCAQRNGMERQDIDATPLATAGMGLFNPNCTPATRRNCTPAVAAGQISGALNMGPVTQEELIVRDRTDMLSPNLFSPSGMPATRRNCTPAVAAEQISGAFNMGPVIQEELIVRDRTDMLSSNLFSPSGRPATRRNCTPAAARQMAGIYNNETPLSIVDDNIEIDAEAIDIM